MGLVYALAAAHPDAVRRLAILDVVIPGDGAEGFSQGGRRWHRPSTWRLTCRTS